MFLTDYCCCCKTAFSANHSVHFSSKLVGLLISRNVMDTGQSYDNSGALKMTDMKMTDHQNCKTWNCKTWQELIAFGSILVFSCIVMLTLQQWNCVMW